MLMRLLGCACVAVTLLAPVHAAELRDLEIPDDTMTPGEVRTTDRHEICDKTTKAVRAKNPPSPTAIYKEYGQTRNKGMCAGVRRGKVIRGCEVDHRVPLEVGGANTAANLWVQSYNVRPGIKLTATHKDKLENLGHRAICKDGKDPAEVQAWFLGDWRKAYREQVGH